MHIVSILNYNGFVFTVSLVDSSVNMSLGIIVIDLSWEDLHVVGYTIFCL